MDGEKPYLEADEDMTQVINGKRIADDTTIGSKLHCGDCVVQFMEEEVYKKPLAIEVEEVGQDIGVADLRLCVVEGADGEEFLDMWKQDKNADFVVGAAAAAPRVRYEPWLGYQSRRTVTEWLRGRLHDDIQKNGAALQTKERTAAAVVSAAAEFRLLGYPNSFLLKAVRDIRDPGLAPVRKIIVDWLSKFAKEGATQKEIQEEVWQFHVGQKVF